MACHGRPRRPPPAGLPEPARSLICHPTNRERKPALTTLSMIQRGRAEHPRRTMVYGVHGVGKSTFGAMAEKPIFIQTEEGINDLEADRFPVATAYQDVLGALSALYSDEHEYQTVVIDSLDWLERLIWAEVCSKRGVESIEDIGYAKGYVFALTQWREVISGLDALRNERGMQIILIAHARIEKFDNPETESYDRYVPRLNKHASALVQEWCDEVLFATYRVHTKHTDEGFNRKAHAGHRHRRADRPHDRAPGARRQEPPESARRVPPRLPPLRRVRARRVTRHNHRSSSH